MCAFWFLVQFGGQRARGHALENNNNKTADRWRERAPTRTHARTHTRTHTGARAHARTQEKKSLYSVVRSCIVGNPTRTRDYTISSAHENEWSQPYNCLPTFILGCGFRKVYIIMPVCMCVCVHARAHARSRACVYVWVCAQTPRIFRPYVFLLVYVFPCVYEL